ncbi:hypothetical protein COJ50_05975 [Bacillus cereus]|uniref:Uncharacterized protein n=1 Tax=Bacillus cereus TaxID=1396 RepID=A0A2A8R6V9_BACCE|nr:hypothetical protein CN450_17590 [Bacillus cereus]PFN28231.1 hypothetical protein COJ50_05975 [Bacillus cereus]
MSPNKNKTKHPKSIVKSTKIPKIYFSQRVLTYPKKKLPKKRMRPKLKQTLNGGEFKKLDNINTKVFASSK